MRPERAAGGWTSSGSNRLVNSSKSRVAGWLDLIYGRSPGWLPTFALPRATCRFFPTFRRVFEGTGLIPPPPDPAVAFYHGRPMCHTHGAKHLRTRGCTNDL